MRYFALELRVGSLQRKRRRRIGTLLFLVPILLLFAFVAYAIIEGEIAYDGTLAIRAQTSSRYYPAEYLNVSAGISGESGITPFSLTLAPGTYTVSFSGARGFFTPADRSVAVIAGLTSYAVGVYNPIPVLVSIGQDKFNTTSATVLDRVTPLIWINPTSQSEVVTSGLTGQILIPPMQNSTYVFPSPGTFSFSLVGTKSPPLVVTSV